MKEQGETVNAHSDDIFDWLIELLSLRLLLQMWELLSFCLFDTN
jgi:hypothetical protein